MPGTNKDDSNKDAPEKITCSGAVRIRLPGTRKSDHLD